jgi:hypothetical protein
MKTDIKGITESKLMWFGNITLDARIKAERSKENKKNELFVFYWKFLVNPKPINESTLPPLWSSDQCSWLQIRRPGFDSLHYQEKKIVGLERGPLRLVSTTEELLDRKVAAPV